LALGFGCCPGLFNSREARQAGRVQPRRGGAQGCAPFSEQQDAASENSRPACGPNGFIVGRAVRVCFFGYFLCTSKESDSRIARNAFASRQERGAIPVPDYGTRGQALRGDDEQGQRRSALASRQERGAKSDPRLRGDDE